MDIRRCIAAAAAAFFASAAHAGSYTDIWFDPQQPGWGVSIVHQDENAFATLFLYGPDGRPTWYVASDAHAIAFSGIDGSPLFHGTLYKTEGSWFGAPFDAARSRTTPVGELYLEARGKDRIRLEYTADGVSGARIIQRFSFEQPIVSGGFEAQWRLQQARAGQRIGILLLNGELLMQFLDGQAEVTVLDQFGRTCVLRGPYTLAGKLVNASGTYSCNKGETLAGTFALSDVEATAHGVTGFLRLEGDGLVQAGTFAGAAWVSRP